MDIIVKIIRENTRLKAYDIKTEVEHKNIPFYKRKQAYNDNKYLKRVVNNKKVSWKIVDPPEKIKITTNEYRGIIDQNDIVKIRQFIESSVSLKPKKLIVPDLFWKFLVRNAIRGKNILIYGPQGSGKTVTARELTNSLLRPRFYFNMGATQDARATLIGNTHFDKETGTVFKPTRFIQAIQTPYAVIYLGELSRGNPQAWNLILTALDYEQRCMFLDESSDLDIVQVAEGVTFIASANIGGEFTATRKLDLALLDRFTCKVEMPILDDKNEVKLIQMALPQLDLSIVNALSRIAHKSRINVVSETPKISSIISSRMTLEVAGHIMDGFSLYEAAEFTYYSQFPEDGGIDSERAYIKKLVQQFDDLSITTDNVKADFFNLENDPLS